MQIIVLSRNSRVTIISAIRKDIKHMNVGPRPPMVGDLKVNVRTIKSMDTMHMNVDLSLNGHQKSIQR